MLDVILMIDTLRKIMGKFCIFPPKLSHFFLKMGKLFAHFEEKNGKILGKTQKFLPVYGTA